MYALSEELDSKISGALIDKIYQIDETFLLKLSNKQTVVISLTPQLPAIFVGNPPIKPPSSPTAFCMIMRKFLTRGLIKRVYSYKFYRFCVIDIQKKSGIFKLFLTFTGKGNNLIVSDSGNIISNFKGYTLGEHPDIKFLDSEELINALECSNIDGFPPFAVDEIVSVYKNFGIEGAFSRYTQLYNFDIKFTPFLIGNRVYPYKVSNISEKFTYATDFQSFSELYDLLFKNMVVNISISEDEQRYRKELKRFEKTLLKIDNEINIKKNFQYYFEMGELLKNNIHNIKKGESQIEVVNYFTQNLDTVVIPLKIDKLPIENVEFYFEQGKKFKRGLTKLIDRKNFIESEIENIKKELSSLKESNFNKDRGVMKSPEIKEKEIQVDEKVKPYKEEVFEGVTIFIGKSSSANDYLVKHVGKPDNLWLHVKDYSGAHVIIPKARKEISQELLLFAAKKAFENSKARENGKGEVIYTELKYVKKPKGGKPGLVHVSKFNTIFVKL